MSEPRGQHYVPQVYLRGFADGDKIRVYQRPPVEGQPPVRFDTNVKNVAKVRDVYSVNTQHGRDRYIDKNFERVESLLDNVLVPVVKGHLLSEAQWDALKRLVAIQEMRSPDAIDGFAGATARVIELSRALYRQHRPDMTEEEIEEAMREEFPSENLTGTFATDPRNLALNATNSVVPEFAQHMTTFHATIVGSGAQDFMTSNRPVVWFDPLDWPPHPFYGMNRLSQTIEVTYPLTRRKCLFLCRYPAALMQYALASEPAVTMINSRTTCGAREMYAYPTTDAPKQERQVADLLSDLGRLPLVPTLLDKEATPTV